MNKLRKQYLDRKLFFAPDFNRATIAQRYKMTLSDLIIRIKDSQDEIIEEWNLKTADIVYECDKCNMGFEIDVIVDKALLSRKNLFNELIYCN